VRKGSIKEVRTSKLRKSVPTVKRIPPKAGPMIKPRLNVVKYFPIQAPRSGIGTESTSNASAVGNTAPAAAPSMILRRKRDHPSRAKPNIAVLIAYRTRKTRRIRRLPTLSEIPGTIAAVTARDTIKILIIIPISIGERLISSARRVMNIASRPNPILTIREAKRSMLAFR
jgi:hypothetical protein